MAITEIRPAFKRSERLMQPRHVTPLTIAYEVFVFDAERVMVPHFFDNRNQVPLDVDRSINHPKGNWEPRWVPLGETIYGPRQFSTLEEAKAAAAERVA